MNAEAIASLIAAGLLVSLGGAVFLADPRSSAGRLWALFTVLLAVWALGDFGIHLHDSVDAASVFLPLAAVAICLFPPVFLDFCLVFCGSLGRTRASLIVPLYLTGLAFSAFSLHGNFFTLSYPGTGHALGHGESYAYLFAWIVLCFFAGMALCFVKYLRTRSGPERTQLRILLLGLGIPALAVVCTDIGLVPDALEAQSLHATVVAVLGVGVASGALIRLRALSPPEELVAERVLGSARDLVCVINSNGFITFSTESFRTSLEVPPDRLWGSTHVKDFVVESDAIYDMLTEAAGGVGQRTIELRYRTSKGREIPASVTMIPMVENGKARGLVLIGRDISDRRELTRLVEESQEKYRNIVESSLDGLMVIQNGAVAFANESAAKTFEYGSMTEMTSIPFDRLVAPGSKAFFSNGLQNGTMGEDIFRNYEMKALARSGQVLDLEINARIIRWNGSPAVLFSLRDITERKALEREQALWFWEQESLTAIDRQLVAMTDLQDLLNLVTRHARSFTRAEFSGVILVNREDQTYTWRGVWGNRAPVADRPLPLLDVHRELLEKAGPVVLTADQAGPVAWGERFPVAAREGLATIAVFPFGIHKGLNGVVVIGFRQVHQFKDRDLRLLSALAGKSAIAIANAELYEDLREREQQLEKLTSARVASQEEERRRIAREIHDGLGQMLTAIKFNVEVLEDAVGSAPEEKKKLDEIKALLDSVMSEAREISYNLMPSVLEDFGLIPALQLLCENVSKRLNLSVSFRAHGVSDRFDRGWEVNLYRIVQEALTNVAKHAGATSADVQLLGMERGARLVIEDNGTGFTMGGAVRGASREGGIGIVSMRERALSFGATLSIESGPGKGTTVIVDIPESGKPSHG